MRHLILGLLCAMILPFAQNVYSQDRFAIIEKNTNLVAKDLIHDLNETTDSLLLRSKGKMHHVYSINRQSKREIDRFIHNDEIKISLAKLSPGKHTFAVSYLQKKILFVIRIYDPNATYVDMRKATDVAVRNN
ncbi:MAG: hypothetical protein KJO49_06205 [Bacteroidia bacterium]|nr:hypothetical protein [Bacteroidia bacterium]MBT8269793.1 hypothetical protein [Bacteroidia bacterium]NNF82408.1 hypothetical protein [Flavobacteriaceae bacterium]NNK70858.1 hypothetical protein [Flavobacteriaceae bacterium]NNL80412.1 hypothetical protein [Flavobacteriaceae bacterium]